MARQEVDIGVEGNDGTGDSIRESFRKVNENFREIYAVVGKGGQISFTSLADTPNDLSPFEGGGATAYIPIVKQDATGIDIFEIASNTGDVRPGAQDILEDTIEIIPITINEDTGEPVKRLVLKVSKINLIRDTRPKLGGPLNANGLGIGNIGTEPQSVVDFNRLHGTAIGLDDLVIDKKFADKSYIARQDPGETINVPSEPNSAAAYTKNVSILLGQNKANISAHGLTRGSDGAAYVFNTTGTGLNWQRTIIDPESGQQVVQSSLDTDPATGDFLYSPIQNNDIIYIGILDENNIGFWLDAQGPQTSDSAIREELRLKLSRIDFDSTYSITDAGYNTTLDGFFLSHQVMPRESVVRRQGDTMAGPLVLSDHPGDLAGSGTPNGKDDLQAVTKLYVDAQSTESSANIFVSTVGDDDQRVAPPGKEGSSLAYAYRTIGAAARKAEAIQRASPSEPGPYMQDIIVTIEIDPSLPPLIRKSQVVNGGIGVNAGLGSRANTRQIIEANLDFIVSECIAWAKYQIDNETTTQVFSGATVEAGNTFNINWTSRIFDERQAELDLKQSITASILDYLSGPSVNVLANRIAVEYYNDEYGKSQIGLVKEVYAALLEKAREYIGAVIEQDVIDITINDNVYIGTYQAIFEQVFINFPADPPTDVDRGSVAGPVGTIAQQRNIILGGVFVADDTPISGLRYELYFSNAINGITKGFVDQGNPLNRDLRVGKVIRGKTSGALGKIISYAPSSDVSNSTDDDFAELQLLNAKEFIIGETLEMGNIVNERQITIKIETGTYYEDYPIRVANNVSLVGDEFRRVLIRPNSRTSQSPWADTYFYRDKEFDGLTGDPSTSVTGFADPNLPTQGELYTNPLTGEVDGYFGRHYLLKPGFPKNVDRNGLLAFTNPGNFNNAAILIERNKQFIIDETISFITARYINAVPGYDVFNPAWDQNIQTQDRYKTLFGEVVDNIAADLREGKTINTLKIQAEIYIRLIDTATEKTVTFESLTNISQLVQVLLTNTAWNDPLTQPYTTGNADQYINTNLVAEQGTIGNNGIVDKLFDLIQFANEPANPNAETQYNPAKPSTDLDVFMMNDATILRNMSVQGHGGFMCVLDPEGQILTKSPYIQTGSSFSQSLNRQAFRGGMLVDAFCANTTMNVIDDAENTAFRLKVTAPAGSGLAIRKPQTPAPFYIDGVRYQVNDIINYNKGGELLDPTAVLILDRTSGPVDPVNDTLRTGWDFTKYDVAQAGGFTITLQTAGNRSQLGNDFTQINDLGYGLVTINGGLSEMVSMFTYYCWTAYYAGNGGQIRSLNGSNANGTYGLVSEGSDPNEVPDDVVLVNDMMQGGITFSAEIILTLSANVTITASDATITGTLSAGGGTTGTSVFTSVGNKVYVKDVTGSYQIGEELIVDAANQSVTITNIDASGYTNDQEKLAVFFYDIESVPTNKGEIEYYHDDGITPINRLGRYELANVEKIQGLVVDGYVIDTEDLGTAASPTASGWYAPATRTVDEGDPVTGNSEAQIVITKSSVDIGQPDGHYKVDIIVNQRGDNYKVGDQFVIKGSQLGGTDGTDLVTDPQNDAIIEVEEVDISAINVQNNVLIGSIRRLKVVSGNINFVSGFTPQRDGQVYKANFSTSTDTFDNDGLLDTIPEGKLITLRSNNTHLFGEIESVANLTIRPSTAVNFQDDPEFTYRSISFGATNSAGGLLEDTESLTGFDASYDYVRLNVNPQYINAVPADFAISGGFSGTFGGATGDTTIAVNIITETRDIWRLNNNYLTDITYRPQYTDADGKIYPFTGELPKVVAWNGKKHYAYNYREYTLNQDTGLYDDQTTLFSENNLFALVDLAELNEIVLDLGDDVRALWPRLVNYAGSKAEAIVRQVGNTTASGKVKVAGNRSNQIKLTDWSGVDFNLTGQLEIWLGDPEDPVTGTYTPLVDVDGDPVVPVRQTNRLSNISGQATGISRPLTQDITSTITLRAGLQDGNPATITIDISTCRATGHDFLDIGTGSFNQTNYPNVILGFPAAIPVQSNEIQERNKGRVFYVSTDQDGFFRVGRFFTVDQGTGTVTFAASIALSDVDGIGFKRGVVVTEFSTDSSMADNADDTVPVESAVRGYVNRRLGYDQSGNTVPNPLGPSVITQNGAVPMLGNLNMSGFSVINLGDINIDTSSDSQATNKGYVDFQTEARAHAAQLRDITINNAASGQFLGFTGTNVIYIDADADAIGVNANFAVGQYLTDADGGAADYFGIIVQVTPQNTPNNTDAALGNVLKIVYTQGPVEYNSGVPVDRFGLTTSLIFEGTPITDVGGNLTDVQTASNRFGTVLAGPYAEIINIDEEPDVGGVPVSDITINTRHVISQDTAYYNLQINDEVIVNQDVDPAADILQSKLYLKEADIFVTAQSSLDNIPITQGVVGYTYEIVALSTGTPVTDFNFAAGTAGVTYNIGDTFTMAAIPAGNAIVKRVKTNTSLPVSNVTRQNNQATLGLSTFDGANFKVVRGYVQLKDNGIPKEKLEQVNTKTVLGRSATGVGNVQNVTFSTVVNDGDGLQHEDFPHRGSDGVVVSPADTISTGVLIRTANKTYETQPFATNGSANSIVKTDTNSAITATTYKIGTGSDNSVLFTTAGEGLTLKNTSGGTILTAAGANTVRGYGPTVNIPGNVNIGFQGNPIEINASSLVTGTQYMVTDLGDVTNAQWNTIGGNNPSITYSVGTIFVAATTGAGTTGKVIVAGNFTQSSLQGDASSEFKDNPFLATNWIYTGFIETPREKGTKSTGIAIGEGSNFANTGEVAIVVAGDSASVRPAVFSKAGIEPAEDSAYNIGSGGASGKRYQDLYIERIDSRGHLVVSPTATGPTAITDNAGELNKLYTVGTVGNTDWSVKTGIANPSSGDVVRIINTGSNGNGTLVEHKAIINDKTGDAYFGGDVMTNDVYLNNIISYNGTGDIGSVSSSFVNVHATTFHGTATQARYADLAENYLGDAEYEPGTVLVFGGDAELTTTNVKNDRRVAGVVTTNPAHLMNSALEGDHVVGLALQGRVPCKVIGTVFKGDMLVTSGIQGYAIVNNDPKIGTVIGKAVETKMSNDKGIVEIVVGRV